MSNRTSVVVLTALVEPGPISTGPPGAHHIDDARFRIERTLSPPDRTVPGVSGEVMVSYTRQVFPESDAETPLERGTSYVLFCSVLGPQRLHALKIVPHSEEAVRVVATAFGEGARHDSDVAGNRLA